MRSRRRAFIAVLVGALGFVAMSGNEAHASLTERVVAVVGERPILLSELRERARPQLQRIASESSDAKQRAAAETLMLRELLNRMIDDRLVEQAADRAHLSATADEVDNRIRKIAGPTELHSGDDVLVEAERQGLAEKDYRAEIRRQLIEDKLLQLQGRDRVLVTDEDARAVYSQWLALVAESTIDLRILVLPISPGTGATVATQTALGQQIVARARGGEDFCKLVARYSPTGSPMTKCGSRGTVARAALTRELAEAARPLNPGDIAEPILFGDPTGRQAVLLVQRAPNAAVTPYEEVKEQMREKAAAYAMDRRRKQLLQELRCNVYIETRL